MHLIRGKRKWGGHKEHVCISLEMCGPWTELLPARPWGAWASAVQCRLQVNWGKEEHGGFSWPCFLRYCSMCALLGVAPKNPFSSSCCCRSTLWLEECSLQSPEGQPLGLPLRYNSNGALIPKIQRPPECRSQNQMLRIKGVALLPSQFISSCIDRSEKTNI